MRYAFSNIAWKPHDDPNVLSLLKERGIGGIEVAPTRVWPDWEGATPTAARRYGRRLRSLGFEVPALQAVLFGKPDAQLFDGGNATAFVSHLTYVAELAEAAGACFPKRTSCAIKSLPTGLAWITTRSPTFRSFRVALAPLLTNDVSGAIFTTCTRSRDSSCARAPRRHAASSISG